MTIVYRAGEFKKAPAQQSEYDLSQKTTVLDSFVPSHRDCRSKGIFCSPDQYGVVRWISGNHFANTACGGKYGVLPYEIQVDPAGVWIYEIRLWEVFCAVVNNGGSKERIQQAATTYWNSGMTLEKWRLEQLDPKEWELLVPFEKGIAKSVDVKDFLTLFAKDKDSKIHNELTKIFASTGCLV